MNREKMLFGKIKLTAMTRNDLEIVMHPQIDGMSMFFNSVEYRTPHLHPEWEVLYVLEKPMIIQSLQNVYHVKPGDLAMINPYQPHEMYCSDESGSCTFLCLQMSPELFSEAYPKIDHIYAEDIQITNYFESTQLLSLKKMMMQMMNEYLEEKEDYELLCLSRSAVLMYQILQHIPYHLQTSQEIEERDRRNARLSRLLQYVDEHYRFKASLTEFAKEESCTLNYMSAFVKESLNQTFQDYVKTVRFHCACKMILNGDKSMQNVCVESGFSDYRYFSEVFRQRTGMTPEQYSHHPTVHMDAQQTHHSLHSLEHFYSRGKSLELLSEYKKAVM